MATDLDYAKVLLGHATATLELILNGLEQQLGDQGKQNLRELENNLGLRNGTLTAALNLAQQQVIRAVEVLEDVCHGQTKP